MNVRSPFCSLASRSVIVDDEQGSWWECFLSTSTWCWRYMRTRWPRVQQSSSRLCSSVHFALPRNSMSSKWSKSKHLLENIPWVPYYHATALILRLPPTGLVINLTFAFGSILVVSAWVCDRISSFFQWVVCSVSMKIKVLRGPRIFTTDLAANLMYVQSNAQRLRPFTCIITKLRIRLRSVGVAENWTPHFYIKWYHDTSNNNIIYV